ncbi:hypothetical protein [Streptomyces sp. F63]|uniref:hypothetical protein n=1 Tax=Streptomyces sp. F63 TaxID=2824887 RepID=UPI001B382D76|nr:hypothetical protein [Streptomyces sp. F63]
MLELVEVAVRFERPWDAEEISSELVVSGWEPVGSVSLPYPKRLGLGSLLLGIEYDRDAVAVGVTLKEWQVDWNSADYIKAVSEGYKDQIHYCRELANRLVQLLGQKFSVGSEDLVLDKDEFPFVYVDCWKVANVHVILGLEHLDPDDTPIRVSLYLSQGSMEQPS